MIYYDSSEQSTKLPQDVIEYGVKFPDLEKITGADFVIVPEESNYEKVVKLQSAGKNLMQISKELDLPLDKVVALVGKDIEYVLHEWLFAGAILVQRKSGFDFVASMGSRLNDAIARMCEVSHKQYQRIILVTGAFAKQGNVLVLDSKITNWNYVTYQGAISSIKYKGACVEFVPSDDCILEWVKTQEKQLLKYKRDSVQWVVPTVYYPQDMPDLDDPLQLMRPVRDARLAIINIPGWGVEKVNALYEYVRKCLNLQNHPTMLQLLSYATAWETSRHLHGIGKTLIQKARDYVGLKDSEYLCVSQNNVTVQK